MGELKIFPYNDKFSKIFNREKDKIFKVLDNCEVHHIGSTAVPGLGGKGIIDIMVALKNWKKESEVVEKMKSAGFTHIHPKEKGKIFLSKIASTKYGDIHIHIVKIGSKPYKEMLFFRDYLRKNKDEAKNILN